MSYRAQVHLLEKEKKSLELVISSQQAQEHALKTHIQHLQDELENQDSMVCSYFSKQIHPTTDSEFLIYLFIKCSPQLFRQKKNIKKSS